MMLSVIPLLLVGFVSAAIDRPNVAFQWKKLDFDYPTSSDRQDAIRQKHFLPENNLPLGIEIYGDRIFLTIPRWKDGVPASLAYINKTDKKDDPILHPYPNWAFHDQDVPKPQIVSPFRMRVDSCGRLWVMDSGMSHILHDGGARQIVKPQLLIFDLKTDTLLRSYTIPDKQMNNDSFFANIAVEEVSNCEEHFGYLADLGRPALVVYDFKNNKSWDIQNDYFKIDPQAVPMNVLGQSFNWTDGIFGMSLSEKDADGYSTLFFHPMTSFDEFTVSTKVLRNESLAKNQTASAQFYKRLGTRGKKTQSGASFLHKKTGVLFYNLVHLNAVACWRTPLENYTMISQGRVYMNDELIAFPNDIKVDQDDILWVITDKLPIFMYGQINIQEYNFRIINATVKEAIKGTACDSKMPIDQHIIDHINNVNQKKKPSSAMTIRSEFFLLSVIFFITMFSS